MAHTSRRFSDMEVDVLISAVKVRPTLWNDRLAGFKNYNRTRRLWDEVEREVGLPSEDCKRRWKSLKDTFRKYLQSQHRNGKKKWKYSKEMEFARPAMGHKEKCEKISSQHSSLKSESEWLDEQDEEDSDIQEVASNDSQPVPHTTSDLTQYMIEEAMVKTEEVDVMGMLDDNEFDDESRIEVSDDDHYFFMSLLPFVSKLDDVEKLRLRARIQDCVIDAVRDHEQLHSSHSRAHP